jgi:hypothetical protein
MEVILRQAVDKLGHPGDIVKVSAGYARNFLLPRGAAYEATPGNKKRIAQEKERLEAAESARVATAHDGESGAFSKIGNAPERGVERRPDQHGASHARQHRPDQPAK